MVLITDKRLRSVSTEVLAGAGASREVAERVAEALVLSNLVGHDSHGVSALPNNVEAVETGSVNPHGEVTVVRESATTALLDGGGNFGHVVMKKATDHALSKARKHDLGMVSVRNCWHAGRLGEYVVQAAQQGFMALMFSTGHLKGGTTAPYLGMSPVFNSNPIAWAVPAGKHPPVFIDYATSACAVAKLIQAANKGESIPEGWLVGPDGKPSRDPGDWVWGPDGKISKDPHQWQRNGALLPFGAHKGYGLIFLIELLSGGLTGNSCAALPEYEANYSNVMMVVNIDAFQPVEEFRSLADRLIAAVKKARKAPGVEEILVPGEPEWKTHEKRLREGIDLLDVTWQRIVEAGARHGVTVAV